MLTEHCHVHLLEGWRLYHVSVLMIDKQTDKRADKQTALVGHTHTYCTCHHLTTPSFCPKLQINDLVLAKQCGLTLQVIWTRAAIRGVSPNTDVM